MATKRSLPLVGLAPAGPPTVDAVRKRLGGRAATGPGAGDVVAVPTESGGERTGVVLFAGADHVHVWVAESVVRKVARAAARPVRAPAPPELGALAEDARVFGALEEGQRVRYQLDDDSSGEAKLIEKCRFGALVLRADGSVLGVGFRRIWPVLPAAAGPH